MNQGYNGTPSYYFVQTYRITGRQLIPSIKQITYYYTYLYGSADILVEWDEEEGE